MNYLLILERTGPRWDPAVPLREQWRWDEHAEFMDGLVDSGFIVLGGPLEDAVRTAHVVSAESKDEIRDTMARDPWSDSVLRIHSIDEWTILLDGR